MQDAKTPLHYAAFFASEGYEAVVKALIAAGADVNAEDVVRIMWPLRKALLYSGCRLHLQSLSLSNPLSRDSPLFSLPSLSVLDAGWQHTTLLLCQMQCSTVPPRSCRRLAQGRWGIIILDRLPSAMTYLQYSCSSTNIIIPTPR